MKFFTVTWQDKKTVKFSGAFDEYSSFIDEVAKFPDEVWLDLLEVTHVNSLGVREWCKALSTTKARIHYINVPSTVMDQFNGTPEFLGNNSSVDSFQIFFVCDDCEFTTSRVCEVGDGKDLDLAAEDIVASLSSDCLRCGGHMEVDHEPTVYFQLFKAG